MLLKGASEVQHAQQPQQALEMLVIRMIYVSDQPTPGDVLKQMKDGSTVSMGGAPAASSGAPRGATIMSRASSAVSAAPVYEPGPQPGEAVAVNSFQDVVALFGQKREMILQGHLVNDVHLVKFEAGNIELRLRDVAPRTLVGAVSQKLRDWTGQAWMITVSKAEGAPTLAEGRAAQQQAVLDEVKAHPVVAEVLKIFPGTNILDIRARDA
jgi:DNA polymerase-3 subunit gamma/tau